MDNEQPAQVILQHMHETRSSLADKLETLEQQVADTVHNATSAVTETVESVKEAVHDTVASVQTTVTTVKESFNIAAHVERPPWVMMTGSVAVGYALGSLLPAPSSKSPRSLSSPEQNGHHRTAQPAQTRPSDAAPATSRMSGFADLLAPEIAKVKGLAVGSLLGLVRDMVARSVPSQLRGRLVEIIDNVTEKLGGRAPAGNQ